MALCWTTLVDRGGPAECHKILFLLFHQVGHVFCFDTTAEKQWKHLISLKKLRQGDAMWPTHKVILGWYIGTVWQLLILLEKWSEKLREGLHIVNTHTVQ